MPRYLVAVVLLLLVLTGCGVSEEPTLAPTRTPRKPSATIKPPENDGSEDDGEIRGIEIFEDLSQDHTEGAIDYDQIPPVGGEHNPSWQNCGIYDRVVRNEHAVHSLEHGAVWITYQPELSDQDVGVLRKLVRGHTHVLLSPYPDLPEPVVITAWGIQLKVDEADDPRLPRFIEAYENGPQNPEPGAPCDGGVGTPLKEL
jgi:hypothetical protein